MNLLMLPGDAFTVRARANWSRWIVDCPVCPSALTLRPGTEVFGCQECGVRAPIEWPDDEMVAGVERLLSFRPDPATRNWSPGESLHDLAEENAAHGVFAPWAAGLGAGTLLRIEGEAITHDVLPRIERIERRRAVGELGT